MMLGRMRRTESVIDSSSANAQTDLVPTTPNPSESGLATARVAQGRSGLTWANARNGLCLTTASALRGRLRSGSGEASAQTVLSTAHS
ncbi:hypothetical protein EXIGLDRAFT_725363, partial [Exidia glandulosa HHB12029]